MNEIKRAKLTLLIMIIRRMELLVGEGEWVNFEGVEVGIIGWGF